MDLLNIIRGSLRITSTDFDSEIIELVDQAISDMISSGVKSAAFSYGTVFWSMNNITDKNIRRAIILFCRANFGIENTEKEWFMNQYLLKKAELLNQKTQYVDEVVADV